MNSGPMLVMLHGWGSSARVWDQLVSTLPVDFEILRPELPGHGASRLSPGGLSEVAQQVAEVVNEWSSRPVWLLGWSLGALVTMQIAMRSLCNVTGLFFTGATPCFVQRESWNDAMPMNDMESFMRDFQQQPEKTQRRFLALQGKGDARYKDVVRQLRIAQQNTGHAIQWGLEALKHTDLRADLGLIDVPVHVLHGKQDAVVPVAAAKSFHPLLKSAAETWEASGHAPFLSEPERFARWLVERVR